MVHSLIRSEDFREFQRAFAEATGLPVTLRPLQFWSLPHRRGKNESPFCALVSNRKDGCSSCLKMNERLSRAAARQAATLNCAFGLSETAVPVRLGERVIGFLQVGQVFRAKPTLAQFNRVARSFSNPSLNGTTQRFRVAYFNTPVVSEKKYRSIVKMLEIFARHLAAQANQIATRQYRSEPPMIARAREFIQKNHGEKLSLAAVAQTVGASTFHFCKTFKKATGLNFTAHLARVRVEQTKSLLVDPNLRISEVAFRAGFQSLAHFNRVFRRIVGESPSSFRARLPSVANLGRSAPMHRSLAAA